MMSKAGLRICLVASLTLSGLGATPLWAEGLKVTTRTFTRQIKGVSVAVEYPRTGVKAIDATLAAYVRDEAARIGLPDDDSQPQTATYTLDLHYDVARNDAALFVVMFHGYANTGGAHPNDVEASFNFLMPDGAQVFLPEILAPGRGLQRVSTLAIAQLTRRLRQENAAADLDQIRAGAAPAPENFAAFAWLPGELRIIFPGAQVAPHAAGVQKVSIPLTALAGLIRPDWRAPAASFDCALAASAMEHAICSDPALARLDRQVAEAYGASLRAMADPAGKDAARQKERQWLAVRDQTCGPAPACLDGLYRDRLAALRETP
jgi:uncharacterized protein YecT (DUF1311 family)